MERLICVDPGVTSGVAIFNKKTGKILSLYDEMGIGWIKDLPRLGCKDTIIYEDYFLGNPAFVPDGIEVIGALRFYAYTRGCGITKQQATVPHFIKARFGLDNLKLGVSIHAKEALYHGLYFLRKDHDALNIIKEYIHEQDGKGNRKSNIQTL
jgi:hypothetical protein